MRYTEGYMKPLAIIVVLVVVLIGGYFFFKPQNAPAPEAPQAEQPAGEMRAGEATGTVTEVDTTQAAVDGPVIILMTTSTGEEKAILVPTMGLPLCAGSASIADAFAITAGQTVSVYGDVNEDGAIVPCESAEHYLRVGA